MRLDTTWISAMVRRTRDVTPEIREIKLAPDGGAGPYPTGAHLIVTVTIDGKPALRHYSLVGQPHEGCWRIAVKRENPGRGGSRFMWSLQPGDVLKVMPPDSHFELSRDAPEYLLMAGGIGITPIRGMASALLQRGARFRMLYAGRSRGHMAYLDELQDELGDRLAVFANDEGKTIDLAPTFAALHPQAEAYVCGPFGLLEAARQAWVAGGRVPSRLVFETFGSSGRFAAEPFIVRVPRFGLELTVPVDRTMLDVLENAGIEVLADCRRGECGLCVLDVLDVEGQLDHRDVFFSARQHQENRKICACVSRAVGGAVAVDPAYRGDLPLTQGQETRP